MSYTYTSWQTALFNTVVAYSSDTNWTSQLPTFIDYAEQRLYRELDLQTVRVQDTTLTLSSGVQRFALPNALGNFIAAEALYVGSSLGLSSGGGTNTLLVPMSVAFLTAAFPNALSSNCGPPEYFCWIGSTVAAGTGQPNFMLGPAPDQPYPFVVEGPVRPTPLSSANATTFLTLYYPDLWFTATMIAAAAFMRNFGSQADNPAMAVSWEAQYQTLFKSADIEQARLQFRSQGWTTEQPRAVTTPPRV